MYIIRRFPKFCKRFFQKIRRFFGGGGPIFNHVWRIILAIASLRGRKSLTKIAALFKGRRTRQAILHCLSKSSWDHKELMRQSALATLKQLGWRPGEPLFYVIDDTQTEKFGKQMEGVSRIWLHSEKRYALGHTILLGSIVYRNVVIPYDLQIWMSEEACQKVNEKNETQWEFQKLTQLAVKSIESLSFLKSSAVTVLFDKYYFCQTVVNACTAMNFNYVAAVKKNRRFTSGGSKRSVGPYSEECIRKAGKWYDIDGTEQQHKLAECKGILSKAGDVKLVFSQRKEEHKIFILATNNVALSAKEVVEIYRRRWSIEVLFKMAKQYLGMGDYQFLKLRGVERYLHLVMIAHTFLTHLALDELDAQDKQISNIPIRLAGIQQTQARLRENLLLDMLDSLRDNIYFTMPVRYPFQTFENLMSSST